MATTHEYGPALQARITPLMTGVGPIEAAIGTSLALQALADRGALPDRVVSLGSAGSRRCVLGEVYQITHVSWRDIDASPLGIPKGQTPFLNLAPVQALDTPLTAFPSATLSTGADIVSGDGYDAIDADMVDMETFAVLRACQRFGVPLVGLRGVSDGPSELGALLDWTGLLGHLDVRLAEAIDRLAASRRGV